MARQFRPGQLQTGSLYNISSSFAITASYSQTASYVNPLRQDVIITGSLLVTGSHISVVEYIDFNPNATAPGFNTGRLHWIDDTKTLQLDTDVNGFELEIGHQSVVRGRNTNSFTLTKGSVVYINGESGNRPTFATASWEGDPSSATTIGIIAQDINSNQTGYAVTDGLIRGINTNAFAPGTMLYLSSSGQYTTTPPSSPLHEVRLGKTITQATQGIIYVDIMNGYEIGELHDVLITSASHGDLITWNSGSRVWKNTKILSGSYGISGSLNVTSATGSFSGSFTGNGSGLFSGSFSGSFSANLQQVTDNGSVTTNAITSSGIQTNNLHVIGNTTITGSLLISGSNTFKNIGPAQFTGSVDITGSGTLNGSPLVTNAVFYPFTASYLQDSSSFNTRILNNSSSISTLSGSFLTFSGSYVTESGSFNSRILNNSASIATLSGSFLNTSSSLSTRVTDLENFSSSLDATYATDAALNAATSSLSSSIAFLSSSYLQSSSSFDTRILNNSASIAALSSSYLQSSSSFDIRILNNSGSIALLSGSYLQDSASFSTRITTNQTNITELTSKTGSYATTGSNTFIGNQIINGNITVNGTASVALLYTTYQTSSIIYSSGSTKFGDTLDDTHETTGSVTITGSVFKWNGDSVLTVTPFNNFTASYLQDSASFDTRILNNSSSIAILSSSFKNFSESYITDSSSFDTRILNNSSSISSLSGSFESFIQIYNTGSFTGSFTGDGAGLYNIPASGIVGLNLSQISSGSVSASISPNTGLQINTNVTATSFTGSLFGTASWAENSVTASYVQTAQTASYVLNAVSASYSLSSSFSQTAVTSNTASYVLNAISSSFASTASFVQTAQTASYILNAVSSSFATSASFAISASRAVSASFATTASHAINALTTASISSNTITFTKGDGSTFPITVNTGSGAGSSFPYTGSALITGSLGVTGSVSVTQNITGSRMFLSSSNGTVSGSTLTVYGSGSTQPVFTVQGSQGELFSITDSLSGSLFSVNDISGLPILEVFSDNTTLVGSYLDPMLITTTRITQTNSGSFTVYSLPTASYDTAFFEYSIKSGSNARAGTIMAIQAGSTVNFTETTTTDIGNTTAVSFIVVVTGSNFALTGSSTTGLWTTKCIIRGI